MTERQSHFNQSTLAKAASSMLKEYFDGFLSELNIITDSTDLQSKQFVSEVSRELFGVFTLRIENLQNFEIHYKRILSLIILKNDEDFEAIFLPKVTTNSFYFDGYFLLISLESESVNFKTIFEKMWGIYVFNVDVLSEEKEIKLVTFMPFIGNNCRNSVPLVINTFNIDNSSWTTSNFFPDKFKNLFKCEIKVSTFEFAPLTMQRNVSNVLEIYGHDIDLLAGLSIMMNFTLNVKLLDEPEAWGAIYENGSSRGVMRKVIEAEADIGIGGYYLTLARAKFMSFSQYGDTKIIVVIPPGVPLSAFEKLFSPFNSQTWIVLLVTILCAIALIFIMKFQSKKVQEFIFGKHNRDPYMNMLDIFVNGSQRLDPKRNFSRSLLMIFIIFCFIIRTLYQSGLYKFLQTDQRHSEMHSIDELIEKKIDIWMYESFQELSRGLKIHERLIQITLRLLSS